MDENLGVCVCPVPKSLSSTNPAPFTPQFVALGPYHHSNDKLIVTDELKLSVVKRIFKVNIELLTITNIREQNFISDIKALYHSDVRSTYESHTLLDLLTLDGLFLLALLHHADLDLEEQFSFSYILTGRKRGMPLVNAAGVKLTMDAIMGDIFMLENQIPTHVLKHHIINNMDKIHSHDDLCWSMLNCCEALSPLVHSEQLSKCPEDHDHLLDLMYRLIAPVPETEPEPEPEPSSLNVLALMFCAFLYLVLYIIPWGFYIFGLFMIKTLQVTQAVLLKVPFLGVLLPQLKTEFPSASDFMPSMMGEIYARVRRTSRSTCLPFILILPSYNAQLIADAMEESLRLFGQSGSAKSSDEPVTIPSATELRKAEIRFKPTKGGISSIKFDDITKEFYLPCMKLDVMSEVLIRNLVAYESLIKSDCLIFGRYIELMSALIHTAEDVKLLIDNEIIQTQLSADFVAQIFEGMPMTKLTRRPTNPDIQKLEGLLRKIKVNFDAFHTLKLFWNQFQRAFIIFSIILLFSPLLYEALYQLWTSTLIAKLLKRQHSGRNNSFISSM